MDSQPMSLGLRQSVNSSPREALCNKAEEKLSLWKQAQQETSPSITPLTQKVQKYLCILQHLHKNLMGELIASSDCQSNSAGVSKIKSRKFIACSKIVKIGSPENSCFCILGESCP